MAQRAAAVRSPGHSGSQAELGAYPGVLPELWGAGAPRPDPGRGDYCGHQLCGAVSCE